MTQRTELPDDQREPALEVARCAAQVMVWAAGDVIERTLAEALLEVLRDVAELSRSSRRA